MARLPVLKPREVVRILEKLGFVEVRQRGSHKQQQEQQGQISTFNISPGSPNH
jgi:predicted RNA binding protein YcfA (HicA-like mRNA interferase family)